VARPKKPMPKSSKKPIEWYEHADKTRKNNPPVGLVTSETTVNVPIAGTERVGMSSRVRIQVPKDEIVQFCLRHHIRPLAFFGSVLRPDFRPDSDVDVLVEFEPGHVPGLAFFGMEAELARILGRKVDLHTPQFLSRHFRDRVLRESEVEYVAA